MIVAGLVVQHRGGEQAAMIETPLSATCRAGDPHDLRGDLVAAVAAITSDGGQGIRVRAKSGERVKVRMGVVGRLRYPMPAVRGVGFGRPTDIARHQGASRGSCGRH